MILSPLTSCRPFPLVVRRVGVVSSGTRAAAAPRTAAAAHTAAASTRTAAAVHTSAGSARTASAAASTSSVSSNASATMAAEHAHSMGVVVHVIKSARALLRAHAIASSDAVRSQHLDAALALLGTAGDSTEASTA